MCPMCLLLRNGQGEYDPGLSHKFGNIPVANFGNVARRIVFTKNRDWYNIILPMFSSVLTSSCSTGKLVSRQVEGALPRSVSLPLHSGVAVPSQLRAHGSSRTTRLSAVLTFPTLYFLNPEYSFDMLIKWRRSVHIAVCSVYFTSFDCLKSLPYNILLYVTKQSFKVMAAAPAVTKQKVFATNL